MNTMKSPKACRCVLGLLLAASTLLAANPSPPRDQGMSTDPFQQRRETLLAAAMSHAPEGMEKVAGEYENATRLLLKEYPNRTEAFDLLLKLAAAYEDEKATALLDEAIRLPLTDEQKETVAAIRRKLDAIGKPLALQFVALDGHSLNMADLKGKVVLIDFWATWCGPCRMEMPQLKELYAQYHSRGLEIVGVSMDEDRAALTRFISTQGLPWQQTFDGKGWDNLCRKMYGVNSLPTKWLIDRKGNLRYTSLYFGLSARVESLLNEN